MKSCTMYKVKKCNNEDTYEQIPYSVWVHETMNRTLLLWIVWNHNETSFLGSCIGYTSFSQTIHAEALSLSTSAPVFPLIFILTEATSPTQISIVVYQFGIYKNKI